ncbi:21645_t:CDS:2 [Entrophospora sp. SA101]|nr:21645_t:CDS:2 [Entrophospora sp. SA101]
MRWCETPNELREFIENNKKISTTDSSSCASSPTLSVAGSPAGSTISTTSPTNTIYVYNVAARSSPSTYNINLIPQSPPLNQIVKLPRLDDLITPPASPKHNNRSSSSFIIAKKQSRKKFNNVRRSSDINTITTNRQYGVTKNHGDSSSPIISERKRKSNSLARVMADRGLSEEPIIPATSSTSTNSGEVKSIRIPPSPPLEYEKLIENLNNMNLENRILNTAEPNIIWKG